MARLIKPRTVFTLFLCSSLISFVPHSQAGGASLLENEIRHVAALENIGAVAYGIISADELIASSAIGTYSREDERPINMESIFRIGSISKTFTALSALLLEHQGQIDLSLPVRRYIDDPPFTNLWRAEHPITGAQLIEHTAGLRDMSRKEFDQLLPLSLADAFKVDPASRITAWRPGQHSSYSNSGAGVITALIETVTEKSFERVMRDQIFTPLALGSATFRPPENMATVLVQGYDSDGVTPIPYWHQLYPAFGALNISSKDMLRFVQLLLNQGVLSGLQKIPSSVIKKLSVPTTSLAAKAGLAYGYGRGLYHFQHNGVTFYGHGGDADGYLAFMALSEQLKRGYYVVINAYKQTALKKIRNVLQDFITRNSQPVFPKPYRLNDAHIEILLGEYTEVTQRFASDSPHRRMEVSRSATGEYFTRVDEQHRKQLLPVKKQLFRRKWQTSATIALIPLGPDIYLQGDFGNFKKIAQ